MLSVMQIWNAVKYTMIRGEMPILEKFRIAKDAGFDGMSMVGPKPEDLREVLVAIDQTGLPVHNVNVADHWNTRLSDPDPAVRKKALEYTKEAIRFAAAAGGSTVLQVVGKATDPEKENAQHVRERSLATLSEAIPLAAELGVRIACENVGNGFGEDAAEWAAYLDAFRSPWVAAFFDIGNHESFGGAVHWVRTLGSRIVKIDVKDHSHATKKNCDLGEGNVDFPGVKAALEAIGYQGWATAEVKGGDVAALRNVVEGMKRVLG